MCSNTSISSSCGDRSGCSGNGYAAMLSSGSKNMEKRPRVPKRGPGVAELEKILREQEKDKVEGFSSTCMVSNSKSSNMSLFGSLPMKSHPHPLPLPPPPLLPPQLSPSTPPSVLSIKSLPIPSSCLPPHVPLAPNSDHLIPATPTMMSNIYGNGGHNSAVTVTRVGSGISGCGVSAIGGSGLYFSEQACCTATVSSGNLSDKRWPMVTSNESNRPWPTAPLPQKRNYQYPSPMINPFLVSTSSSTSSAARLYSHLEPPSNQNICNNYSYMLSEEQKTIGMKRSYPFSSINSLDSPHFHLFPMSPFIDRQEQTSSYDLDHSFTFSNASLTRMCNIPSPYGACEHGNFQTRGNPTVSSPTTKPFEGAVLMSKCNEKMEEDSNPRSESVGPYHQPYYSFLQEKDHKGMQERSHGLNSGRCESESGSLDLSLKL